MDKNKKVLVVGAGGFIAGHLIKKLIDHDINLFIILHSTIAPNDEIDKQFIDLFECFRLCKRILVHSPDDMNRLKRSGLVENVTLFPHGILENNSNNIKASRSQIFPFTQTVIATHGFCLPFVCTSNRSFRDSVGPCDWLRAK